MASRLGVVVANVFQVENEHVNQHHQTIQGVKEDFVGDDVTMVTLKVLNDTHNGTDENQNRTHNKRDDNHLPVSFAGREVSEAQGERCWVFVDSDLENGQGDNEKTEKGNLDEQTNDNQFFTQVQHVKRATRLHTTTGSLQNKGQDIAADENLGEILDGNHRLVLGV